jgi:hypothetical protein
MIQSSSTRVEAGLRLQDKLLSPLISVLYLIVYRTTEQTGEARQWRGEWSQADVSVFTWSREKEYLQTEGTGVVLQRGIAPDGIQEFDWLNVFCIHIFVREVHGETVERGKRACFSAFEVHQRFFPRVVFR